MKRLVSLGFGVFALDRKAEEPEPGVIPVAADVTDVESVRKAAEVVVRHTTDELFALVHQAGIYRLDSLVEMSEESFEKVFRVNLFGVSLVNRIFFSVSAQGKPPCDHHKRAGAAPSSSVYRNLCREQERFGPVCLCIAHGTATAWYFGFRSSSRRSPDGNAWGLHGAVGKIL